MEIYRLHCIYGTMRLLSLLADFFVIYHAKDLKITDSQDNDNKNQDKIDKNEYDETTKNKKSVIFMPEILTTTDEEKQQKSLSLPRNTPSPNILNKGHKRSLSRDYNQSRKTSQNDDLDASIWRKSSQHIAGPINEY